MGQKVVVILGQTASGKSDLAVKLAKQFKGEVISADSRQVYKGLDIGTGKITKKEMKNIPHHLLDIISPQKRFSVSTFKDLADKKIEEISKRNALPILCGGTGFYIDAVTKNTVFPEVLPDMKFRASLEKLSTSSLFKRLKKADPLRAKAIDQNNKVRIIRALEIIKTLGKVPKLKPKPLFKTLSIGILWEKEDLHKRIKKRLLSRIKAGMIEEAKRLHKEGLSYKRMEELGLEYRYLAQLLKKEISKEEMVEKLNTEIRHYAKRQATWFRRDKNIIWLKPDELQKAKEIISNFLSEK